MKKVEPDGKPFVCVYETSTEGYDQDNRQTSECHGAFVKRFSTEKEMDEWITFKELESDTNPTGFSKERESFLLVYKCKAEFDAEG